MKGQELMERDVEGAVLRGEGSCGSVFERREPMESETGEHLRKTTWPEQLGRRAYEGVMVEQMRDDGGTEASQKFRTHIRERSAVQVLLANDKPSLY